MKKQMIWGSATLILLLSIAAVFLFIGTDADTENVGNKAPSDDVIRQSQDANAPKTPVADAQKQPQPPGETNETGYWHGDHWHKTAPQVYTREDVLNMPGVIPPLTSDQVKAWKVQQQEREAKLRELAAGQQKREPHPHDALSPEEHQRWHTDVKALAGENDFFISDVEKMLDDLKSGRYKNMPIEEVQKRIQDMELRVNARKKLHNSQK